MRTARTLLTLAGLFSWLLLCNAVSAQPAPINGQPAPVTPPAASVHLDDKTFPDMLQQLGYRVEAKVAKDGGPYWVVQTQQEGWGFVVEVVPQRNNATKKITGFWLISDLGGTISNPAGLSAPALLKLMEKCHEMAPFFFTYNPGTKHIAMNYEYPFGSTDQKNLKTQFDTLFGKIRDSYAVWKSEALAANASVASPAPASTGLAGSTWAGTETLQGYGKLTFQFAPGGKATMHDSDGVTPGVWSQSGNLVTVSFHGGSVSYKGTLKGNAMNGSGHNGQQTWSFSLTRQK